MLNTAIIQGRLVADPELRHTSNDIAVTNFTVAVERSYTRQGEERQADFIDVVAWRNTAEFVCKYFGKGQMIALQGSIQTRSYTDSQGNKRKAVEIIADQAHFCESKHSHEDGEEDRQAQAKAAEGFRLEADGAGYVPAKKAPSIPADDFDPRMDDDDLPF